MAFQHQTPRIHQLPNDPAHRLLDNVPVTPQKVHRRGCYICEDREFARMGLPLCKPCCQCASQGKVGHIAADNNECDDCTHELCEECFKAPAQEEICTCDTPCCQVDVGFAPIMYTCGSQHCPTHGGPPRDHSAT